jgi:hypothetical protein
MIKGTCLLLCEEKLGFLVSLVLKSSKNGSDTAFPNMKQSQVINQYDATNMCYMNA